MIQISPLKYVAALRALYGQHASADNAAQMARYMKNHFAFFGIKQPERLALSRQFIKAHGTPEGEELQEVCQLCFEAEEREMQYFVKDLGSRIIHSQDADFLDTIEVLMLQKSWWDTVDFLAPKLAGKLLFRFPDRIADYPLRWIKADNRWLQRAAILFQLDYKAQTDAPLLFDLIRQRADSTEFFVQKAAGWALRQYARTNPETVRAFIREHELPKLTVREGMKHLKNERK